MAVLSSGSVADLYAGRYEAMVRLAHLLTGSNTAAEELVQDAFVRVLQHWDRIDEPEAYLRTAVVNACRSWHRRRALERRRAPEAPATLVPADVEDMRDALGALSPRQRAVVVLRYYEDLAEDDIATVLGCRPGTVKSLLHRGLEQLRKVVT